MGSCTSWGCGKAEIKCNLKTYIEFVSNYFLILQQTHTHTNSFSGCAVASIEIKFLSCTMLREWQNKKNPKSETSFAFHSHTRFKAGCKTPLKVLRQIKQIGKLTSCAKTFCSIFQIVFASSANQLSLSQVPGNAASQVFYSTLCPMMYQF